MLLALASKAAEHRTSDAKSHEHPVTDDVGKDRGLDYVPGEVAGEGHLLIQPGEYWLGVFITRPSPDLQKQIETARQAGPACRSR